MPHFTNLVRHVRDRRGATLALAALSVTAMISMFAVAVDLGMLFTARSEAQRAADAAALAGASAFLEHDPIDAPGAAEALAIQRIYEYAEINNIRRLGIEPDEISYEILLADYKVRVRIRRQEVPLVFARIFGITTAPVAAKAAAVAAEAGAGPCVKPFAIPDMWDDADDDSNNNRIWDFDKDLGCNGNNCDGERWRFDETAGDRYVEGVDGTGYGTTFRDFRNDWRNNSYTKDDGRRIPIKINEANESSTPSYWFPFVVSGRGAASYVDAIQECYPVDAKLGESLLKDGVETENGNMPKPTWDAIVKYIDDPPIGTPDPGAYWDEVQGRVVNSVYGDGWRDSPRVINVAVFNPEDMRQGKNYMRLVDFAAVFLEDPRREYPFMNPNHMAPITGRVIRYAQGGAGPKTGKLIRYLRLVE